MAFVPDLDTNNTFGKTLEEALLLLKDKKVEIIYNTSNKLADYDAQLVVGYREEKDKVYLIVSNFKLEV